VFITATEGRMVTGRWGAPIWSRRYAWAAIPHGFVQASIA